MEFYHKLYASLLFFCVFLLITFVDGLAAQSQLKIKIVKTPATVKQNDYYVSNQAPLLPSPLIKLPVGAIRPEGWLGEQLQLMSEGFTGHLTEISKWCRMDGNAWVSPQGTGHSGWEELPYWLKGFINLGYVMEDQRIIAEATRWIEGVLASQDKSGYFGPRANLDQHDIWPNMVMLYALRTHHEANGDQRVIELMRNYFRWLMTIPLEQYLPGSWQKIRGGDNLDHIYWLYNRTGEKWLLDLARLNHERTSDWTGGIPTWHGVNICQGFREPGQYYQQTGDVRYLLAAERNYREVMELYGQVPGGMFGADENARPGYSGPRQGAETCSMVEFMHSDEMLVKITGAPIWADRCEEIAFNSLPAAMTPDLKGLHYLTAPNMIQLDRSSKAPLLENWGDMLSFNPHQYRCCQHNVAFGWPYYAEHLWLATANNGLAAVMYASSTVTAQVGKGVKVKIKEITNYPFDETVEFKISTDKSVTFPLTFRIPGWCQGASIAVNGKSVAGPIDSGAWIVLEQNWQDGDQIKLELPMTLVIKTWDQNDYSVSVYRGPLIYSLKIGERWQLYGDNPSWPAYEVFPTTAWNYGLIVDKQNPSASFELIPQPGPLAPQPFTPERAPVQLRARGKRIPDWQMEANGLVGALKGSPIRSSEPVEELILIPMGCARLRITAFPRLSECPDANEW